MEAVVVVIMFLITYVLGFFTGMYIVKKAWDAVDRIAEGLND